MSSVLSKEKNVLGGPLLACSYSPLTGFFRDRCCATYGAGIAPLGKSMVAINARCLDEVDLARIERGHFDGCSL